MTQDSENRYGIVRIGDVYLGFPIINLIEVFPRGSQTLLPGHTDLMAQGVPLRGQMIPLINLGELAGIAAPDDAAQLGVILEGFNKFVAFYIEEIIGIETIDSNAFRDIGHSEIEQSGLFGRGFFFHEKYVTIVDVAGLMAKPGILTAERVEVAKTLSQESRVPMMTFEAGSAIFAVPAIEVYAAVPKQQIQSTAITSGPCLGEIRYHDRRIPVVCPARILGLGSRTNSVMSEVVVMRFPEDRIVGFAVDSIIDIQNLATAGEASFPSWQKNAKLISSVHLDIAGRQIFALDVERLRMMDDLAEIAKLSESQAERHKIGEAAGSSSSRVIRERERYLVIELDEKLAVPLLQVICILDPPKYITPIEAGQFGFLGYFERLGETVALIDLKAMLGQGAIQSAHAQVILSSKNGQQVGFLVEKVLGIEVSHWREHRVAGQKTVDGTYVQLGGANLEEVLLYFDLLEAFPQPQTAASSVAQDASLGLPA